MRTVVDEKGIRHLVRPKPKNSDFPLCGRIIPWQYFNSKQLNALPPLDAVTCLSCIALGTTEPQ